MLPPNKGDNTVTVPPRPQAPNAAFNVKSFLSRSAVGKKIQTFAKGHEIFAQGEAADSVFFIQKGKVKVTVLSAQGKEAVVGILAQGQFFGEACLDGVKLRTSTSHAMEECLLTSLTKDIMIATLNAEPKFSAFFLAYLLARNSRVEDDLIDQLFNSSERRLARLLLLLANFGKGEGAQRVPITLNQATLAEMIGTTRSRVSLFMNKFRKRGYISYNGKIEVHSSLLDAVLHDKPQINGGE